MPIRLKLRFPDRESYQFAQKLADRSESFSHLTKSFIKFGSSSIVVKNEKRLYFSVEPAFGEIEMPEMSFDRQMEALHKHLGAEIVEDYQYDLETDVFDPSLFGPDNPKHDSLADVLDLIEARSAWTDSTGKDVAIAVVDTGIDGTRPEIPISKRAGEWQPLNALPWTDFNGHGTMTAVIAAGTRASGGAFFGVAPNASIICCKTSFLDSELAAIYDYLVQLSQTSNLKIVATNSWGIRSGTAPPQPQNSDFLPALDDALAAGIHVFFSAGNNHQDAGGAPNACDPNSIWLHKCRADVMTVGACDMNRDMWYYSSRGPGQFYGQPDTNLKPDVTAPTPRNGRIVWGNTIKTLADGWGTSGACPQAAGLAALLLSKNPALTNHQVIHAITAGAMNLSLPPTCGGHGLINCRRSIALV